MKLIASKDLKLVKGITLSYSQRKRLSSAGKFPKPIRYNGGERGLTAYIDEELDEYIARRAAERDDADTDGWLRQKYADAGIPVTVTPVTTKRRKRGRNA